MKTQFKAGDMIRMKSDCRADVPKSAKQGEVFELVEDSFGLSTGKGMYGCTCEEKWELVVDNVTLETMSEGVIILDPWKQFRKVLAVIAGESGLSPMRVYVISNAGNTLDDGWKEVCCIKTAHQLEREGYSLRCENAPEEMTMEQVNKALGKTIKIIE